MQLVLCFYISQDDPLLLWENNGRLKLEFGQYDQSHLYNAERIVVSPGVSIKSNNLEDLIHKVEILIKESTKILVERIIKFVQMKQGHPVVSELEFASEKIPKEVKMIAVTGTNGKSTVTSFSGQVLYLFGAPHEHAVG